MASRTDLATVIRHQTNSQHRQGHKGEGDQFHDVRPVITAVGKGRMRYTSCATPVPGTGYSVVPRRKLSTGNEFSSRNLFLKDLTVASTVLETAAGDIVLMTSACGSGFGLPHASLQETIPT